MIRLKSIYFGILLFLTFVETFGQVPQRFSYQSVIRNNSNNLVANHTVQLRISISSETVDAAPIYIETHKVTTSALGLVSIQIGAGLVEKGSFTAIPWSSGKVFLKTETDLNGGTNYTISGTQQLLSVPYSQYADNVKMTMNGDTINIGSSKLVIPGAKYISGGDAPASLSNGLVAYYPFNGNANDASGNKNHGVTNNVTLSTDRNNVPNSCYYFNGNDNSNIVVPHSSTLCPDSYLSISCWVRIKSSLEWNNMIVKRLSYYAFPYNSYILGEIANDSEVWKEKNSELLTFGICTEEILDYHTNLFGPTNIDQWYHLSVVYDGTTVSGYTNGKKIISQSLKGKIKYSDLPLYFGYTGIDGQNFNGCLDEVRIYDRVLTQDEITFLANN